MKTDTWENDWQKNENIKFLILTFIDDFASVISDTLFMATKQMEYFFILIYLK